MKNNKILSTLLLMTAITSMVAGAFSINRSVYRKADAASSYKTVFLYLAGNVPSIPGGHVTKTDGSNEIVWDQEVDQVRVFDFKTNIEENPGHVMKQIDTHIFAYTLYLNNDSDNFIFTTKINGVLYRSHPESGSPYRYKDVTSSKNLLTMRYYNCGSRDGPGEWSSATNIAKTVDEYVNVFLAVVGDGTCDNEGNTTLAKLSSVWSEMSALVQDSFKGDLVSASIEGDDPINKFAALYNYIYWKYDSSVGSNFLNREITSLASVARYNPVITDNNVTTNVVVVSSISLVSLSIIGIYFYIRKRKEDK